MFFSQHSGIKFSLIAFNNPVILRNEPKYHNLLGFTQEEIKTYFKYPIECLCNKKGKTEEALLKEIKEHYNGYKYHVDVDTRLSNAYAIQNYFHSEGKLENFWHKSGSTKILLRSLNMQGIPDLRNYLMMMDNRNFKLDVKEKEFKAPKEWKVLQKDFKQMCFDSGYLTISDMVVKEDINVINLKIPNVEIFDSFQELLRMFLITNDKFGYILSDLKTRKFKKFLQNLEKSAFEDKTFLNFGDKEEDVKDDANYEIFLHQLLTMTLRLALKTELKKGFIKDYIIENEKALKNQKSIF